MIFGRSVAGEARGRTSLSSVVVTLLVTAILLDRLVICIKHFLKAEVVLPEVARFLRCLVVKLRLKTRGFVEDAQIVFVLARPETPFYLEEQHTLSVCQTLCPSKGRKVYPSASLRQQILLLTCWLVSVEIAEIIDQVPLERLD